MNFKQIAPPAYLQPYIRCYWVLESRDKPVSEFRTIADGCPGLIFQHSDKGLMFQENKQLPHVFLFGQATHHATIRMEGSFAATGIFFRPNALQSVFGMKADDLTNTCIDLQPEAKKQGFYLDEQLAAAAEGERLNILSEYLLTLVRKQQGRDDPQMQYALARMVESSGMIAMKILRDEVNLTERSFERRFKQYIGMPPGLFARICRFQNSLQQLRNNDFEKLSDIAFDNDYADQSHFIRAFKEFAGCSPKQYQQQAALLMDNLAPLKR
ncbi:helix-turn-helix domain-containing protein [Chitinophaga horti]|uniref:Helix-turn-helix domain-containing protein n=1 Tax=Chitinophaga horti TaxID=2920382 RepID=A0ABY6IUG1_9BACT|nr:helix-turn-helix domain-containing protein [Chitinophaga horti]UYQ91009.1 helix-turn-helix domain-containing protein [Chitinophaga horti]